MPTKRSKVQPAIDSLILPEIGFTEAGSIRLQFRPAPPLTSLYGHERRVAALVHDLASELELRCEHLDVGWVVSAEPFNARIDVEVAENEDPEPAAEFVVRLLSDLGLAWKGPG